MVLVFQLRSTFETTSYVFVFQLWYTCETTSRWKKWKSTKHTNGQEIKNEDSNFEHFYLDVFRVSFVWKFEMTSFVFRVSTVVYMWTNIKALVFILRHADEKNGIQWNIKMFRKSKTKAKILNFFLLDVFRVSTATKNWNDIQCISCFNCGINSK